ncbi:hypothetical protein GFY24_38835 [Nocardia sp. SYP-A9097]|uniref:hypothetical protein n=1 Tax=Nocardia sp. SYP-A9097 TaxID=2663237 RepID=UPI00129ACFE8|nr:hypothetical protein [Nocardia sp. SYP-A9097]MRH93306.1 hypothetical protein [Nocardia sp. SYP-A9097]
MTGPTAQEFDIRALLGMNRRAAWVVVVVYLGSLALLAASSWRDVHQHWVIALALITHAGVCVALMRVAGDPLPIPVTVSATVAIPATAAMVLLVLPADIAPAQLWPLGAGAVTAVYLCVRGRTAAAWTGMVAMLSTAVTWSLWVGHGAAPGIALAVGNAGPLLMATFFARTIRPAVREISDLHQESERRAAQRASAAAGSEERVRQLHNLDRLVRPVLDRIAGPDRLDTTFEVQCRLLEARLRDSVRAPALCGGGVIEAARAARIRGVEVILVDDHGLDAAAADIRGCLLAAVTDVLEGASAGTVAVRVLPPHRHLLATIVVDDPATGARRLEFDHQAAVIASPFTTEP